MLGELLRHNYLGGTKEIAFILFDCFESGETRRVVDLKAYSNSRIFTSAPSFDAILVLLEFVGFLKFIDDRVVLVNERFNPSRFEKNHYFSQEHFYKALFTKLNEDSLGKNFLSRENLRFDSQKEQYYLVENRIEFKFLAIRNLLLNLGFLYHDEMIGNHLFVHADFSLLMETMFVETIRKSDRARRFTLDQLKTQLQTNEELGRQGELFVLDYEKKRLSNHRFIEKVIRISDDFVNAGFDIESFENDHSIVPDRFIEVKTYSDNISFYWSENEIDTAKRFANSYWLYLVHAGSLKKPDYVPKMFQNPYLTIFDSESWLRTGMSWKFTFDDTID